jgi:hypothetical protein
VFKKLFIGFIAAGTAVVGFLGGQLKGIEDGVQKWRTENLATFVQVCPYMKTPYADYVRAWDRKYPYDAAVAAFAENHRQYFPELTPELAKQCFTAPVKAS